jgi:uncharacterized protein (DUF433 family)
MNPVVASDPAIMFGKPVIAGTRIPVELIVEKLAAGETVEELLLDYPRLTPEAVSAALRFAVQVRRERGSIDSLRPTEAQSARR